MLAHLGNHDQVRYMPAAAVRTVAWVTAVPTCTIRRRARLRWRSSRNPSRNLSRAWATSQTWLLASTMLFVSPTLVGEFFLTDRLANEILISRKRVGLYLGLRRLWSPWSWRSEGRAASPCPRNVHWTASGAGRLKFGLRWLVYFDLGRTRHLLVRCRRPLTGLEDHNGLMQVGKGET